MSPKTGKSKSWGVNLLLIAAVIALAVIPLATMKNAKFGGADGEAEKAINAVNKDYKPWFNSPWVPPSGEIESLLFALQAAIGSGIVFYCLGYMKGRSDGEKKKDQ